jgi:hypothetical protein
MRRSLLTSAVITAVVVAGAVSISAASQAAVPSTAKSKTLTFHVVFSPFSFVAANNVRVPHSPVALGDELTFHDQLSSKGQHVGDDVGSCVIVSIPPAATLGNCTAVFRVPGGNITAQFPVIPGPTPKDVALTGGTGTYRNVGGNGTLVEFGNGKGRLTLHVLSFASRGQGA